MQNTKADAVILKRINLFEADRIVTAFSKETGKIRFVAKGVRRTKSKLAGSIEPFCRSELILANGKNLDILTSASIKKNYLGLNPELETIKFFSYISEITDKIMHDESPNPKVFELLDQIFSDVAIENIPKLKIFFLIRLFEYLGIAPEVRECIKCGKKPENKIYISLEGGGILDQDCSLTFYDKKLIDINSIKVILAARLDLNNYLKIKIDQSNINEVQAYLDRYLKNILGKPLKSQNI